MKIAIQRHSRIEFLKSETQYRIPQEPRYRENLLVIAKVALKHHAPIW